LGKTPQPSGTPVPGSARKDNTRTVLRLDDIVTDDVYHLIRSCLLSFRNFKEEELLMHIKTLISILVLFSLLAACNLQVGQAPVTQPSNVDMVGTAVELTAAARLTEIAGSVTPTFTAMPALTAMPTQCTPLVTSTVNANVRSGPDTAYDIVGSLSLGQTATLVGRNDANTWWYIAYPGAAGGYAWIAGSVVMPSCVPAVMQVVAAPPLPTTGPVADASSNDSGDAEDDSTPEFLIVEMVTLGADLRPVGMSVSPNPATQGEEVHVQVGVKNDGNVASGSFTVQWWSTHSKLGCGWTVSSLAPGESANKTCSYTYGGWANYDIKLVIDSGNAVAETNEDNNSMARKLEVRDAP
jgi:hypothetical protein